MSSIDVDVAIAKPDADLVRALADLTEDQWFERKSGRIAPKDVARPLIAFANAEGGTLVVGLHDGKADGVPLQRENEIRQAAIDYTVPPVRMKTAKRTVGDQSILIMRVDPGETIHTNHAGDCFLRVGDASRKLSLVQQQELAYDRGSQAFEATPSGLEPSDLSQSQLVTYQQAIGSSSVREMLAARDLVNRAGELAVAGTLLFDERPQRDFPSAYVRILRYDDDSRGVGSEMTLVEEERIEGSLPQQIEKAASQVERWIPKRQQLTSSGRFEKVPIIPRDAWLEGLVNAVVHRSYSMMGDHIRVELFPRRVEISSPGRFPGLADPSHPLTISRFARNPRIARVCADMGITRELGEGIKRIFHEMQRRGLADPVYQQKAASVSLVLSSKDAVDEAVLETFTKSARKVLAIMRLQEIPLGTGQVAELADIARPTASRALQSLADAGLVRWTGTSERDPRASWEIL